MKKIIAVILAVFIILCTFASCKKSNINEPSSRPTVSSSYTNPNSEMTQNNETQQNDNSYTKPTESQTPSKTEPANDGKVVTYISENPDNIYICRVAEKYGSDKANLMAFIKMNASTPGATVLEFSGNKDSDGNLIVTADELRYVYEVSDNGTIRRASSDGKSNDGYNKVVAKVAIALAENYFIPNIDKMRSERRYEDYFSN